MGRHYILIKSEADLEMILKVSRRIPIPSSIIRWSLDQGEFVFTEINTWSVMFVKLTILTFYHRVFPNPRFRIIVKVLFVFFILWHISVWGVTTFGCLPVRKWWVTETPGHCINLLPFGIVANLINILSDFFVFLMPVPLLWKLKVSVAKRITLCCLFSLGLA